MSAVSRNSCLNSPGIQNGGWNLSFGRKSQVFWLLLQNVFAKISFLS